MHGKKLLAASVPMHVLEMFTSQKDKLCTGVEKSCACIWHTGWPTKISLFFFDNKFYKNKETFKIFSPQILEVYRILLVETTVESIMFYYTFSVINTMFVPCTALLYDSTAATRTLKLSTTLLSISCGIRLISFLMMPSLVCGLFSQTLSFRYLLRRFSGGLKSWE